MGAGWREGRGGRAGEGGQGREGRGQGEQTQLEAGESPPSITIQLTLGVAASLFLFQKTNNRGFERLEDGEGWGVGGGEAIRGYL